MVAPHALCDDARAVIDDDPTVANIVGVRGDGASSMLFFDVARENANPLLSSLRKMGVEERGSITMSEPLAILSDAADHAERLAPGNPDDALVWDHIEEVAQGNSRFSVAFVAFLVLATLIASVGRYLDQPILIVGAMVVGPEFAPIAAICVALVRGRWALIPRAAWALLAGFLVAGVLTWLLWLIGYLAGGVDFDKATSGTLTEFIIAPDIWSFIIAVLAGCAGVLSLTSAKSAALVGVFISVTTVPALATIALASAVGAWSEVTSALIQLSVNVAGLLLAGVATLLVQQLAWRWFRPSRRQ